jgi:hypothetical protein
MVPRRAFGIAIIALVGMRMASAEILTTLGHHGGISIDESADHLIEISAHSDRIWGSGLFQDVGLVTQTIPCSPNERYAVYSDTNTKYRTIWWCTGSHFGYFNPFSLFFATSLRSDQQQFNLLPKEFRDYLQEHRIPLKAGSDADVSVASMRNPHGCLHDCR